MSANSKIEWTHHTFNPWWGCVKVSPGCQNCYAESFAHRYGHNIWGPAATTTRRLFGDKHWAEPLKWNAEAARLGERHRVFCASMADVFEDHPMLTAPRQQLFSLIDATPNLDWLLLTKRPENIKRLWPFGWYDAQFSWPNIWLGASVENQEQADKRIPELFKVPGVVRFLSCEPLLGPLDLTHDLDGYRGEDQPQAPLIDWVIVGGESGPGARPMHPQWALSLRDQCQAAGVAFHFKQWGEWLPALDAYNRSLLDGTIYRNHIWDDKSTSFRVGKKLAGRLLGGREWNEYPKVNHD